MRRTLGGIVIDSLQLWLFMALLTLFVFLIFGAVEVQNHYYFDTAPFTYQGQSVP